MTFHCKKNAVKPNSKLNPAKIYDKIRQNCTQKKKKCTSQTEAPLQSPDINGLIVL